jgi:hypothetical protein
MDCYINLTCITFY